MISVRKAVIASLSLLLAASPLASASAVDYGVTATPTTDLKNGDSVTVTVAGLTGTVGVYASICKAGATAMDTPTPCDDANAAWITATGGGGSTAGAGTVLVDTQFSTVDCTVDTCVLYVRGDHNNSTNYALIRVQPLTFVGGGTAKTPDTATAQIGDVTLEPNQAGTLRYRTPVDLIVTAASGLPVTLTSLTNDCVVSGTKVKALVGSGQCAIAATTAGNDTYAPLNVNFPFYVKKGIQKIVVKLSIKKLVVGKSVDLPKSTFKSNFGATVKVKSLSPKTCTVVSTGATGWTVTGLKVGACKLVANAAKRYNKWTAATQKVSLPVKKK